MTYFINSRISRNLRHVIGFIFLLLLSFSSKSQTGTFLALDDNDNIYKVTIGTSSCSSSKATGCHTTVANNLLSIALDGTTLYIVDNNGALYSCVYNPTTNSTSSCKSLGTFLSGSSAIYGLTVGPTGIVYASYSNKIETYTPSTKKFATLTGTIGSAYSVGGDLLFYGGKLYEAVYVGGNKNDNRLIEINLSSLSASTEYLKFNTGIQVFGFASVTVPCSNNQSYALSSGTTTNIYAVDMVSKTQSASVFCTLAYNVYDAASVAETQSATAPTAPTVTSPFNFCLNGAVSSIAPTPDIGDTLRWYTGTTGGTPKGAPSPTVSSSSIGVTNYYVSQFDVTTGCESPRSNIVVNVVALPTISISTATQSICQNAVAAAITSTAAAGSGTISSYQWYSNTTATNTGGTLISAATSASYAPSTATVGTLYYYCVVTNSNGCSTTSNVSGAIVINGLPTVTITPTTQSVCINGNTAALIATANTATGTITGYTWYYNTVNSNTGGLTTGVVVSAVKPPSGTVGTLYYYCVITNSNNCTVNSSTSAVIINALPSVPTFTTVDPTCTTSGAITVTSPVGAGFTYSIDGTNFQASPAFATGISAGNYTLTVKNGNGCTNSASVTISPVPSAPPTPVFIVTQPTCTVATGSITVTAVAGITYTIGSTNFTTTTTINNLAPNSYIITATNIGGCTTTTAAIINAQPATPTAPTVTTPVTYCQNATASALSATGTNLLWYGTAATGGTGSTTATVPLTTISGNTNYYVSQTNASGCESPRATIVVSITATPSAPTVTTPVTYCQNAIASALSATGSNLLWYGLSATGGTGSSTATVPSTATVGSSNYYVSQTVSTCESPRAVIVVTINGIPIAPTVTTPVVYCQNATASALTATGTNLLWYGLSATGGTGSSTATVPSTATVGSSNYYVSQTVSTCESPRAVIVVTVNANPSAPTVTTPVAYCQNATASALSATGSNLLWYGTAATGGTGSTTATIPATSTAGSSNYYVSQTVASCESPRASILVAITATPSAPTVVSPVNYCLNTTASALTATGTSLLWYGTAATGGTGSATAPTPLTTTAGTTSYYVSQKTGTCESPRAVINVRVNTATSSTTNATICSGSAYTFNGSTYSVAGTYTKTITNVAGCDSVATLNLAVETFKMNLSANPNPANSGAAFIAQITANLPIASSTWQPSNLFVNNQSTQTIVAPDTSFTLIVTGTSANGCKDVVTGVITVIPVNNTIFIPNALTPAATGTDASVIKVYGTTVKTATLLVYNQWGQLIFQSDNATTKGWDGTFNGTKQPSGVYTYAVKVTYQNNKTETRSGSINLIR